MIGETVDSKYKLVRLLGEGGMGSVYEAEHVSSRERVAVKVINSRLLLRPSGDGVARFRREARAAGAIDSEHIVRVLNSGTDETSGLLYLVMECLQGEDLQHLIERLGPLAPDAALRIAAQALVGLSKAHEARIVHRDIKPANLFLARREDGEITVKLLDFGIAKIKADPLNFPHTTGLTNTSGFLGSPMYMSPEQLQNSRDVDHRTDLWSLGSALYCALTGQPPYANLSSVGEIIFAILRAPPLTVQKAAPWIPADVAKMVRGALAIRPEERYPSAEAMLSAIRPLISGDMALRDDMLIPVSSEQRAQSAPKVSSHPPPAAQRVVMNLAETQSILGNETTQDSDPAARTRAESAASFDPERLIATTTGSHEVLRPAVAGADPAPAPRARAIVAAGVALVVGLGAVWGFAGRSQPPKDPANAPATSTLRLLSPSESAAPPAPEASTRIAPIQPVRLVVSPSDASVEVDGVPARVSNGSVEIAGALGSTHRVRLFNATSETQLEVFVTEQGAMPSKIELPLPVQTASSAIRPGKPRAKPISPLPARTNASAAKASAAPNAAPPNTEDDDIKRTPE